MKARPERLEAAAQLIRGYWRECVLTHLRERRRPAGSAQIADALGAPHYTVQRALCDLIGTGHLADVGRGDDGKPLYRPVEIGPCEWCGILSHRLVAGECPRCRERVQRPRRGWDADEPLYRSLGAEADISHAIAGVARGELPR